MYIITNKDDIVCGFSDRMDYTEEGYPRLIYDNSSCAYADEVNVYEAELPENVVPWLFYFDGEVFTEYKEENDDNSSEE